MSKFSKILLFSTISLIIISPAIGFAAECPAGVDCPVKSVDDVMIVLKSVAKIMYQAFFIVAIIFIILAGFNYLTAKDDAEKIKSASKQLMLAAVAIAVVLMAFGFSTLIKSFIGP